MRYLSQLLGAPVVDHNGVRIGKVIDILIPTISAGQAGDSYASTLLVEGEEDHPWRVPSTALEWSDETLRSRLPIEHFSLASEQPTGQDISLAHEVLDRQVIDIVRKKAVRVNDVCLTDDLHVEGIDNSTIGLVRRLAPPWLLGHRRTPPLITWDRVELIGTGQQKESETEKVLQIPRPTSGHLADLHPADIAEIVHQLSPGEGARLIERLDDETAADTMEEIDTERQSHILENIQPDRAADILEAMEPDEAADLLAKLPEERAEELLKLMTPQESEDVQELLEYSADSAGGLMTTDYIVINQDKNVADALASIRLNIEENDIRVTYIYCVADETQYESRLLGIISLWDLLIAPPTQVLQELMERDFITVHPDADPRSVAEVMAKYNLYSIPVVSESGILEGVVTVDDALDVLLPTERRRRPTRMY